MACPRALCVVAGCLNLLILCSLWSHVLDQRAKGLHSWTSAIPERLSQVSVTTTGASSTIPETSSSGEDTSTLTTSEAAKAASSEAAKVAAITTSTTISTTSTMSSTSATVAPEASHVSHAAVMIIGHARSLVWGIVCENIKTRLVDALAKPEPGQAKWNVEVFLFLSLVDKDSRKVHSRLKQKYREDMLQPCIRKLKPIYVEFMPPTYTPPKEHGCSDGNEPEYITQSRRNPKEKDYPTRMFSQCRRVELAHEHVLKTEAEAHRHYSVFIKTRPDAIYLKDVPPLSSMDLSRISTAAGGYFDIFQLIPSGCSASPPQCLRCADVIIDSCKYPKTYMDGYFESRVHPVLARATGRQFFDQNHIKIPHANRKDGFGWLNLECSRWQGLMSKRAPGEVTKGICEIEAKKFLHAEPPVSTATGKKGKH